jgi:hypothetical protein
MTADPDSLATRFAALAPEPLDGDWIDVQRRLTRRRGRAVAVGIVVVLAVTVVGSAVAIGGARVLEHFGTPVSDATATLTRSHGRYVLSVTNIGRAPIDCLRFRPAYPVVLRSAEGLRGASPPTLSFNVITAAPYLSKGGSWHVALETSGAFPRGVGGTLSLNNPSYRDTCVFPGREIPVIGPRGSG